MKLNQISATIILIYTCAQVNAQNTVGNLLFANTNGLKQSRATFYQTEGYTVFDAVEHLPYNENSFRKLARKYKLTDHARTIKETSSPLSITEVVDTQSNNGVTETKVYYYIPVGDGTIRSIGLATILPRDTAVENFLIRNIVGATMPDSVFSDAAFTNVNFAGRKLTLPATACGWMGINNIQCSQRGQMNWSTYRSQQQALLMTQNQSLMNSEKRMYDIQGEEKINIIFEGIKMSAQKVTYKISMPKIVMGSNILIVYYITALVRGRYVSCVLSYYDNQGNDKMLPPLLQEVMVVE